MKRLVESFENFFLTEANQPKRLPTMFEVMNMWLNEDGFRLVGRYNIQTNEGRAALFTYRHDIAGSPIAFIVNGDSSMYVIWNHALSTADSKERQNSRGRKTKKDAKIDYYVKSFLSPGADNHKLSNGVYVDFSAVKPAPTKMDSRGRDIIPEPAGWAFYHGPNKRQKSADYIYDFQAGDTTVGAILKDLFGDMREVYAVRQQYDFKAYVPFHISDESLNNMEFYKKLLSIGFIRCGAAGEYGEYRIDGTKFSNDEVFLLLPIDSVEWFNQTVKKKIYNPDENGVATIHISISGRIWVESVEGREGLAHSLSRRRHNRFGSLMSPEDWNLAFQIAYEWFMSVAEDSKESFAIHGSDSSMTRDDLRINNDLNAAIDELW